ncbi:FAD:protein FMN transferase [Thiobacillus sp.]|uniref:FAD:protein FMN transferase n=1 Tax=Thiobacillus sp. TaxID=924 RepID=UPI00286E593F|nr:FAD:protein FMN transferase [Thiobacillus sp.]
MISRRAQPWLGTLVEIVAEGADMPTLLTASDRAFARIAAVHAAMSFQSADSELTRVNREAQTDWAALSPDLAAVFAAALEFARASAGLFDPSVAGWLVAAGCLPRHPGFPAAATPDWRAIELDGDRVRYARPLLVDLSGIAKGYAVDAALASLATSGLAAATVNAGGDLARFGDDAVPVHVRLPQQPTYSLQLAELKNGAAATSASYFQPDALRHPGSGDTLCAGTSVTVLAADCMTADALTKVVATGILETDPLRAGAPHTVHVLARYDAQAIVLDGTHARRCDADGWHDLPLEQVA